MAASERARRVVRAGARDNRQKGFYAHSWPVEARPRETSNLHSSTQYLLTPHWAALVSSPTGPSFPGGPLPQPPLNTGRFVLLG